jgi:hypothetical protein
VELEIKPSVKPCMITVSWDENKAIEQLHNWPLRNLKKMLNSSFPKRYVELKVLIKMDKFGRRSLVLMHMFS